MTSSSARLSSKQRNNYYVVGLEAMQNAVGNMDEMYLCFTSKEIYQTALELVQNIPSSSNNSANTPASKFSVSRFLNGGSLTENNSNARELKQDTNSSSDVKDIQYGELLDFNNNNGNSSNNSTNNNNNSSSSSSSSSNNPVDKSNHNHNHNHNHSYKGAAVQIVSLEHFPQYIIQDIQQIGFYDLLQNLCRYWIYLTWIKDLGYDTEYFWQAVSLAEGVSITVMQAKNFKSRFKKCLTFVSYVLASKSREPDILCKVIVSPLLALRTIQEIPYECMNVEEIIRLGYKLMDYQQTIGKKRMVIKLKIQQLKQLMNWNPPSSVELLATPTSPQSSSSGNKRKNIRFSSLDSEGESTTPLLKLVSPASLDRKRRSSTNGDLPVGAILDDDIVSMKDIEDYSKEGKKQDSIGSAVAEERKKEAKELDESEMQEDEVKNTEEQQEDLGEENLETESELLEIEYENKPRKRVKQGNDLESNYVISTRSRVDRIIQQQQQQQQQQEKPPPGGATLLRQSSLNDLCNVIPHPNALAKTRITRSKSQATGQTNRAADRTDRADRANRANRYTMINEKIETDFLSNEPTTEDNNNNNNNNNNNHHHNNNHSNETDSIYSINAKSANKKQTDRMNNQIEGGSAGESDNSDYNPESESDSSESSESSSSTRFVSAAESNSNEASMSKGIAPFPARQYKVIYVDCPWKYDRCKLPKRNGGYTYPALELEQIKQLPVKTIADPDGCMLFLWVPCPKLPQAFEVITAWGFTYSTVVFCWIKTQRSKLSNVEGTSSGNEEEEENQVEGNTGEENAETDGDKNAHSEGASDNVSNHNSTCSNQTESNDNRNNKKKTKMQCDNNDVQNSLDPDCSMSDEGNNTDDDISQTPGYRWGPGSYSRPNIELCLLAKLAKKPALPRRNRTIRQLVFSPGREHSRKPCEVRNKIQQMFGNVKRIELFARFVTSKNNPQGRELSQFTDGWDSWGNNQW